MCIVCRMCFEVKCVDVAPFAGRCAKGNQVSTIVQITDICPECGADHLDIQVQSTLVTTYLGLLGLLMPRVAG